MASGPAAGRSASTQRSTVAGDAKPIVTMIECEAGHTRPDARAARATNSTDQQCPTARAVTSPGQSRIEAITSPRHAAALRHSASSSHAAFCCLPRPLRRVRLPALIPSASSAWPAPRAVAPLSPCISCLFCARLAARSQLCPCTAPPCAFFHAVSSRRSC